MFFGKKNSTQEELRWFSAQCSGPEKRLKLPLSRHILSLVQTYCSWVFKSTKIMKRLISGKAQLKLSVWGVLNNIQMQLRKRKKCIRNKFRKVEQFTRFSSQSIARNSSLSSTSLMLDLWTLSHSLFHHKLKFKGLKTWKEFF